MKTIKKKWWLGFKPPLRITNLRVYLIKLIRSKLRTHDFKQYDRGTISVYIILREVPGIYILRTSIFDINDMF
jgi:hypothetical protein